MKIIISIALIILLASCGEVLFKIPQPEKADRITKIPDNLWGFYKSDNDTLLISEYAFQFRSSLAMVNEINFDLRNEEVILKKVNENYYLNIKKNEDNYEAWQVARFQKNGKELDIRYIENLDSLSVLSDSTIKSKLSIDIKENESKVISVKSTDFNIIDKMFDESKRKIFYKR